MTKNIALSLCLVTMFSTMATNAVADNRCGSIRAGKALNISPRSVGITGDTVRNGGVEKRNLGFWDNANSRGICDADRIHRFWRSHRIPPYSRAVNTLTGYYFVPDFGRTSN